MKITVDTEGTMLLVARYCYPEGFIQPADSIAVAERDPQAVRYQNGAVGFDFVEIYEFSCNGKYFQCLSLDPETYYWGQELSLEELRAMPDYADAELLEDSTRFVLTDWGAVSPLPVLGKVIPMPAMCEFPLNWGNP